MSRSHHPLLDDWIELQRGTASRERAQSLRDHLEGCPACTADARLLRELEALPLEPWGQLPAAQRARARAMPTGQPAPPPSSRHRRFSLSPADVRSFAGVPAASRAGRALARSIPGADLSVMVTPPEGEGLWRIRARVWLRPPHPTPARLVLVHQDHVLADVSADPTGRFRLEEALAPGFRLEIHLPDGQVVELRDTAW